MFIDITLASATRSTTFDNEQLVQENFFSPKRARDGEFVAAQILPDILDRVQLWSVGRQADERDVAWNG